MSFTTWGHQLLKNSSLIRNKHFIWELFSNLCNFNKNLIYDIPTANGQDNLQLKMK